MHFWRRELHAALEIVDQLLAVAGIVKHPAMLRLPNTRAALSFFISASWSPRMSIKRRRWLLSTSGNLLPRVGGIQVRFVLLPALRPVRTWLSRSRLGEIARDA